MMVIVASVMYCTCFLIVVCSVLMMRKEEGGFFYCLMLYCEICHLSCRGLSILLLSKESLGSFPLKALSTSNCFLSSSQGVGLLVAYDLKVTCNHLSLIPGCAFFFLPFEKHSLSFCTG